MTSSAGTKLPFLLKRLQFPIKPAFALTVNRSQSQTFAGKCGIILPRSIWTHGECTGRSCCCHPPDAFTVNNELFNTTIYRSNTVIFHPGQLYVSFSRCGNPDDIFVWVDQSDFHDMKQGGELDKEKTYTHNIVYQEVI